MLPWLHVCNQIPRNRKEAMLWDISLREAGIAEV